MQMLRERDESGKLAAMSYAVDMLGDDIMTATRGWGRLATARAMSSGACAADDVRPSVGEAMPTIIPGMVLSTTM